MKIYDISQELFTCTVFPGDPAPEKELVMRIDKGDLCNLTKLSLCAHNGTHIDAPNHFINDGKTVDRIDLNKVIGLAYVVTCDSDITRADAERIYERARRKNPDSANRILVRGKGTLTSEAAEYLTSVGIGLVGTEYQSVGPQGAPKEVHTILLSHEVVLLEGIRLSMIPEGVYLLNAAPINLGGCDGAPCRAVLIDFE